MSQYLKNFDGSPLPTLNKIMKTQSHLPSLLSALLFILAAILFLGVALIVGVTAFTALLTGEHVQAQRTIIMAISIFEALILLVGTFISIQRYRQQPFAERETSFSISVGQVIICLIIAAIVFFIGNKIGANDSLNWLFLPALTLPAVALPIFVVLGLGIRGIPLGERWQSWSIFGVAMTLAPFLLIFLEGFALIVVVVFVAAFLASQPDFLPGIERLSQQITILGPDPEALRNLLLPYLTKPAVLSVALFYFAFLVPLMEELLKPLGVWLYAKKLHSPAQGFALGALSGSAYALIETLGVSAQSEEWASLLLARVGTGLLHITTTAIMGTAIFYAFHQRGYLRLLGTYLLSVSLHGLWNALALLYGFSTITDTLGGQTSLGEYRTPLIISMSILAGIFLITLLLSNRRMRLSLPKPIPEESIL
jgi:hypothetical protein